MSGEQINPQDTCGCCDGVGIQAPVALYNRPGLSAVAYRIGTHGEILASLLARLSSQGYPALAKLRTRDSDDFSIALLDAYACMADVLTFYQERIANESWLRTAGERLSLSEMARLIGYRLKPGVAAETFLAFTMQSQPQQPPGNEPKQASGVPDKITLDAGMKVQSIPGPGEKPQTFETVESVEMRPEWNVLQPRLTMNYSENTPTDAWFKGTGLNLRTGDGLLFVNTKQWFVVISAVIPHEETKTTQVLCSPQLDGGALSNSQAYVLRRRAAVFGNNAPDWSTMPEETFHKPYIKSHGDPADKDHPDWPKFIISPDPNSVDLESHYPGVTADTWAVLVSDSVPYAHAVTDVGEKARSEFALAAKVTRLTLGAGFENSSFGVRDTTVYFASEKLELAAPPDDSAVTGETLVVNTPIDGMLSGRTLIVTGVVHGSDLRAEGMDVVTVKSIDYIPGGFSELTFVEGKGMVCMYRRDTVAIYANVARATHGETVKETLGSGAAGKTHQRFTLSHAPLTYVGAGNETGAEAALEVRVNDIVWHEAPTLYNAAPNDRSYVLRTGENGEGIMQFGDGLRGARLPTGQENVRAIYRKGIGAAGNLKAGQLSQLLSRPLGLKAVSNPLPSSGGVDADSAGNARRNMPLGVRTLGRVVSVKDYEDYARAYTGIAKAQAVVLATGAGRTVVITVAGDDGVDIASSTQDNLLAALRKNGDPLVHCQVEPYVPSPFNISLTVTRDPDHDSKKVLADVKAALLTAFSFDARDFGQAVSPSEAIAVAQKVEGVLGVNLVNPSGTAGYLYQDTLRPDAAKVGGDGTVTGAQILLLDETSVVEVKETT